MTSDVDLIRALNAAVAARDLRVLSDRIHPEIVWEHNLGVGTPEEGVYRGRESVIRLFERILEPWEQMRAPQQEVRALGGGAYHVRGELHAKHATSEVELVTPYEQWFEFRDGVLVKGRMINGPRGDDTEEAAGSSEGAVKADTDVG